MGRLRACQLHEDTSANSTFLAGFPAFCQRLGLRAKLDQVFVASYLLRDMGLYAGMDSIVLANNAARTRFAARVVIIYMQSNLHKRLPLFSSVGNLHVSG
jgi:hypothetical protein